VADAEPATPVEKALELGAFEYVPDWTSRVAGLGGSGPAVDPNYVFHTLYSDFGEDEVVVSVRFEGLQATTGIIVIRIGALPRRQGAMAFQVAAQEFPTWVAAKDDAPLLIRFRPSSDNLYAVMGHIFNETDAAATGIRITARPASEVNAEAEALASKRRSEFGAPTIAPAAQLTTVDKPSLTHPVSQMPTPAQYRERVYGEWSAQLSLPPARDPEQWRQIYTLQVLRRYGLLEPGARGVCFGSETGPLPALLASIGCTVVMTDPGATGTDMWRRPQLCSDELFDLRVSHQPVDPTAIPASLSDFDFLLSQPDPRTLPDVSAVAGFFVNSMACLKPAGLAVHIVTFNPNPASGRADANGMPLFHPGDFERMSLTFIGQSHEVAQINYDDGGDHRQKPFGFIIRRGVYT
jgi:hypothetical protein